MLARVFQQRQYLSGGAWMVVLRATRKLSGWPAARMAMTTMAAIKTAANAMATFLNMDPAFLVSRPCQPAAPGSGWAKLQVWPKGSMTRP